jgi:DNA-binding response OmpR family regulator
MADILIVDDDDQLRQLMCKSLSLAGHLVSEAANGVEATRHLRVHVPDLMITDIIMPDMDGLQLIRETKKKAPQFRILAITGGGTTDPDLRLRLAQEFGADDTLLKPFGLNDLTRKVSALLRG